jgi:hypothetical protein
MAINVELLARVRAHILEDERRIEMSRYARRAYGRTAPPCGTTACIAGWAVILTDGLPKRITDDYYASVKPRAINLLGLSEDEADRLFFVMGWPRAFHDRYRAAERFIDEHDDEDEKADKAGESKAQIVADLIDHIIRTGKVTD